MSKKEIKQASPEDIKKFLEGHDDEKYIVSIELDQTEDWSVDETNKVYIVIDDPENGKKSKYKSLHHFVGPKTLEVVGFMVMILMQLKKQQKLLVSQPKNYKQVMMIGWKMVISLWLKQLVLIEI